MAITKINTPELFDLGTTNSSFRLPSGDTASRPSNPNTGEWRYNTDDNYVEYWDGSAWFQIDYEAVAPTCTTDTINYPSGTTNTAYYKMSDATDSTLNGYNGTATNVDFNVAGKFGNAGEFNGSSSYISTPYIVPASSTASISIWFNTSSTGNYRTLFSDAPSNGAAANTRMQIYFTPTNTFDVIIGNNSGYWIGSSNSIASYIDGNWHNLIATYNGTDVKVYIDGSLFQSFTSTISFGTAGNQSLVLGKAGLNNVNYWNGSIDQVRIFPTALTAGNVTSLYNEVQCVPAIIPSDYFEPVIYTGAGGTQSIDDLTFQPDLVWIKNRDNAYSHQLYDSVRGTGSSKNLQSDNTSAEGADANLYGFLSSFDSNGYTVQSGTSSGFTNIWTNQSGQDYVAWNWKAGGAPTTTNSAGAGNVPTAGSVKIDGADSTTALAGTIAATSISANTEAGFSIVSYTGSGSNASFGHGLSQTPELVIIKRTSATEDWFVLYDTTNTPPNYMKLNTTATGGTSSGVFPSPATSSVVNIGNGTANNASGSTYISYCFHSVDGMSDIGSYVGTGASGNTIVTGFRPAFVMVKQSSNVGTDNHWNMWDNKRVEYDMLRANTSDSEFAGNLTRINFLSNGFKMMDSDTSRNASGASYIYLAIAEEVYNANAVTANQTNPFNDGSQVAQYEFEDNATNSQPNGYIGKGGTFNGSSSNVNLPNLGISGSQARTVSMWVKLNSIPSSAVDQLYSQGTNNNAEAFNIQTTTGGKIQVSYAGKEINSSTTLSLSTWYNVVVIYKGGAVETLSNTDIYINGVQETVVNGGGVYTGIANTINSDYSLGYRRNISTLFYDGSIDQVRIYNTALNPNDVWLLYSETSATSSTLDYPASTGAIALYELEGNANDTGGTYNGTATDVAWVPLYDGTPTSMTYAAPSVSAPFLKAGVFNGSSSRIDLPSLGGLSPSSDFTVSCWVYAGNQSGGDNTIVTIWDNTNIELRVDGSVSNTVRIVYYSGGFGAVNSNFTLTENEWTHITVTYKFGIGFTFYKNSISSQLYSFTATAGTTAGTNKIGQYSGDTINGYFNGSIDQVRIFNRALDSGEVTQLYNEPNN